MTAGGESKSASLGEAVASRVESIVSGQRLAIARGITAIENRHPGAELLASELRGFAGRAHVVGITGAPGAGKSTLISALITELLARGRGVAVVAVDPSSPISGGSVLGDRIRMSRHGDDARVFIRSLASRGHLGGVSVATAQVVDLLDAAGFPVIIVETVGAGQSEVDISRLADTSVVVCPPGLGDDVQAIKAGILEIADVLCVNKGDLPLADRTLRELREMLSMRARRERDCGWQVPVLKTVATSGDGIAGLADSLDAHAAAAGVGRRLRRANAPRAAGEAPAPADDAAARIPRLLARDPLCAHLQFECVEGSLGSATVRVRIGPSHLNFNGACHGGVIFALADTAFGLASNSHGVIAAGIDAHITFNAAVRDGDVLTARATEISRGGRVGVYRVDVARQDGALVSAFTGTVYVTPKPNE